MSNLPEPLKVQQFKSRCGESTIKTQKPGIIQAKPQKNRKDFRGLVDKTTHRKGLVFMATASPKKCWEILETKKLCGFEGEKVFVGDTLKLAEMILKMQRFEGINIKRWCQRKKGREAMEALSKKNRESTRKHHNKKKTCYHFRGHKYRTNNFMCNSALAGSSSHEQRIFG